MTATARAPSRHRTRAERPLTWAPHVALCALAAWALPAAAAETNETAEAAAGTSLGGGSGILRGEAAAGRGPGSFTFAVGQGAFVANGLFGEAGERDLFYQTRAGAAWDPVHHLQVTVSGDFTGDQHTDVNAVTLTTHQSGNPTLALKGYHRLGAAWHVGAQLGARLPTRASGAGLDVGATSCQLRLLATFQPRPPWQLSLNLGGTLDRSRRLVPGALAGAQRLALQVWDGPRLAWTLGLERELVRRRLLAALAFAEAHQDLPLAPLGTSPPRLAAGARGLVGGRQRLELMVAYDARLGGGAGAGQPAAPAWRAFAQLALHLAPDRGEARAAPEPAPPLAMTSKLACAWDVDCAIDRTCEEGECRPARRVTPALAPAPAPAKTYVVVGQVQDGETRQPVLDATASVRGFPDTRLAVEPRNGTFHTWPLTGEEDVEITASANGFLPARVHVKPFEDHRQVHVTFVLRPDPLARPLTVRGVLRDRVSGAPVHGTALVTAQNRVVKADRAGAFEFAGRPGRLEVVFAAPGYITQRRQLAGTAGEVIIYNVDMEPFASAVPAP